MFKWLNKAGVESDRGFIVQSMDRFVVEYREGEKKIGVYVERGFDNRDVPAVIIDQAAFERWDNDANYTSLSPAKQQELLSNFVAAMEFQGMAVVVV